jgi:hypothetical protein
MSYFFFLMLFCSEFRLLVKKIYIYTKEEAAKLVPKELPSFKAVALPEPSSGNNPEAQDLLPDKGN